MKDKAIIAIDFDGTCVAHEYPRLGREIGAAPVIRDLVAAGHRIILWTMRDGIALEQAKLWFEEQKIPLFGVNRNPEQDLWTDSPKAYAHLYIDDAAFGAPLCNGLPGERPFIDWEAVRSALLPNDHPANP